MKYRFYEKTIYQNKNKEKTEFIVVIENDEVFVTRYQLTENYNLLKLCKKELTISYLL